MGGLRKRAKRVDQDLIKHAKYDLKSTKQSSNFSDITSKHQIISFISRPPRAAAQEHLHKECSK